MMIPYLKLRLLAAVATPLLVLHPGTAHCAPTQTAAAEAVQLDHISIEVTGKGPPIFLVPGLSSPRAVWADVVPALAKTHRVYLVQVNGFGGDDPRGNLKPGILDGIVADLDGYITGHKIKGAKIVGHSMGGLVALIFAKAHPADVASLMIVDSLPFYGTLFGPTVTTAMIEPQARAMRDQLTGQYGKADQQSEGAEKIANQLASKPSSRVKVKAWMTAADPRVSGAALYEDLQTDLRPDMAAIKTPITLVYPWGATGPAKPVAEALYKGAYAAAPAVTFVDIGDAVHFVMLDQPEAFAAALKNFADAR